MGGGLNDASGGGGDAGGHGALASPPGSGISTGCLKFKRDLNRDLKRVLKIQEGFQKGP